jgi:type VI secretion system protein ImpE
MHDQQQHNPVLPIGSGSDIVTALATLRDAVRRRPSDQQARMFLFQLLCIVGAWDKARLQVRTLAQVSPEAQMLATAYGQAIDGERVRADAFASGGRAALLVDPGGWAVDLVAALDAEAAKDADGAAALRERAFANCPDTPGTVDGQPFETLFDGDTRFGPTLEAIVAGRWGLIPFTAIDEIITQGPIDLRDLVWLPAEIRLRQGRTLAALLPARYPGTEHDADDALRLARRTDWNERPDGLHGLGQRVLTTDAGDDIGMLGFRRIRFDRT